MGIYCSRNVDVFVSGGKLPRSLLVKRSKIAVTLSDCEDCTLSHLSLVVKYAKQFLTVRKIADILNECNVPTKQDKMWHPSLNSLTAKKSIHFNFYIYFSDTPVGIFSRKMYPPAYVKRCFLFYFDR